MGPDFGIDRLEFYLHFDGSLGMMFLVSSSSRLHEDCQEIAVHAPLIWSFACYGKPSSYYLNSNDNLVFVPSEADSTSCTAQYG